MIFEEFPCSCTSHSTTSISQSHSFAISAKRSNPSAVSTGSKKPFLHHTFRCPHPDCNKSYKSVNGLRIHFGRLPQCASFRMSIHNRQAQAALQPPSLEHLEVLTEYPWDDVESLNKLHEAVIVNSTDDNHGSVAPTNQVYSESANDAALRFGIRFTTKQRGHQP